jgi:magnesium-protoporphyrin IX monomethyl ester (oxidative) cyclase
MLDLDAAAFDADVIRHTNDTAARAFPSVLDVDHPDFFPRLQKCSANNLKIKVIDQSNQLPIIKFFRKVPLILGTLLHLLQIYLAQPIDAELNRGVVH